MRISQILIILLIVLTGCATDTPSHLAPQIIQPEASNVTRSEATLSAKVSEPGALSSFRFRYWTESSSEFLSDEISPGVAMPEITISGLRAGTEYTFVCEGWSSGSSAVFRSEECRFTTEPNDHPSLSDITVLSSGPVGLIAGFEITDDGGEPLTAAGFSVSEANTSHANVYKLPDSELSEGFRKLYIGSLEPGKEYKIVPFAANRVGQFNGDPLEFHTQDCIILGYPGELKTLLGTVAKDYDEISISGLMNGDDFRYLRLMLGAPILPGENEPIHSISCVDITDVSIMEGGIPYDENHYTEQNVIGTGMFGECPRLKRLRLPLNATRMKSDALSGSSALERIEIPAGIVELSPSSGCVSLSEITVSPANTKYASADGVLFNAAKTDLIWFPQGKKGNFTFPASVTKIGANAFSGTSVSSLQLPSSLSSLGEGAFSKTVLQSIVIPDGVSTIPRGLFQDSSYLTEVTLGKGTNLLGSYVFGGVPLIHLHVKAEIPPVVKSDSFSPDDPDFFTRCELHVPKASLSIYRNHQYWNKFSKITAE